MKTARFGMRMDARQLRRVVLAVAAEERATGEKVSVTRWIEVAIDRRLAADAGLGEAASASVERGPTVPAVTPGYPVVRPPAVAQAAASGRPPVDRAREARIASLRWNLEER